MLFWRKKCHPDKIGVQEAPLWAEYRHLCGRDEPQSTLSPPLRPTRAAHIDGHLRINITAGCRPETGMLSKSDPLSGLAAGAVGLPPGRQDLGGWAAQHLVGVPRDGRHGRIDLDQPRAVPKRHDRQRRGRLHHR